MVEDQDKSFVGHGRCLLCGKNYQIDFHSKRDPMISGILSRISARSLAMPIIFFNGLQVCSYVGGVAGIGYLRQAKYVAQHLGRAFPVIVIWRPRDSYIGVGQFDALIRYREFSGSFDLSKYSEIRTRLRDEISRVEEKSKELELDKESVIRNAKMNNEQKYKKIKTINLEKTKIRKESDFTVLVRNLKVVENLDSVMRLHPCIIDYAVNVGLRLTSEQWVSFLEGDGSLTSGLNLQTNFDHLFQLIESKLDDQ